MNEFREFLLNQIKEYCNKGIKIFPMNYKSKVPMKNFKWKEQSSTNYEEIKKYIEGKNGFNLAMPTGKVNNVFVLDIDKGHNGFETLKKLENKLGSLPDTVTVLTGGGGKHFYFKYPEGVKITGVACLLGEGVDTRTDNNYVVIPPSTHETGKQYQWEKGKSPFDIKKAELPPAWINALVEASNKSNDIKKDNNNTLSNNIITDKITEGNRETSLFRLACSIRRNVKSKKELETIIQTMNKVYCTPQLSEEEVKTAVNSAWNYQEKSKFVPEFYSLADLNNMNFPEPNWIIPDLMPSGLHMIAGKPKEGKSWLVLNMALIISNGGILLDKYLCNVKNILYLALEDTGARIQKRLKCLESLGNDLSHIIVSHNWATMKQGGLEALEKTIIDKKLDLIFIDTLQCFRGPDILKNDNVYVEDYYVMGELKKLADKYNIAIVLIHHLNKSKSGHTFDNVSGSNGIVGACDTIYTIAKEKENTVLSFKGRDVYGDDIYYHLEQGLCKPINPNDISPQDKMSIEQRKVFDVFRNYNEAIGIKEITEATGYTKENVKYHLGKLKEKGFVQNEKRGKYVLTLVGEIT